MKNLLSIISILISFAFLSCEQIGPNEQIDEGTILGNKYTSEEIGWTIEIPSGWEIILKDKIERNDKNGARILEEKLNENINYEGVKHLISFQIDNRNTFLATSEPFTIDYDGQWEENNSNIKDMIYSLYTNQGLQADTSSSNQKIDGLVFNVLQINQYNENGEITLYQSMYTRHINGLHFGVVINSTSLKIKEEMIATLMQSKFTK